MRGAAQATKNTVDALIHLPSTSFIEVYERCARAPDCRTAAAKAYRVNGFSDGHSVNVQSSENCPPAVQLSGRRRAAGQYP
jgi:hypothetical protein